MPLSLRFGFEVSELRFPHQPRFNRNISPLPSHYVGLNPSFLEQLQDLTSAYLDWKADRMLQRGHDMGEPWDVFFVDFFGKYLQC